MRTLTASKGTNYTPVNLPPPKKLVNPFEKMAQQTSSSPSTPTKPAVGGAKKLTWSERQALAKKQQEEEEARSKASSFKPVGSTGTKWTPPSAAPAAAAASNIQDEHDDIPAPPPPPPLPPAMSRPTAPAALEPEPEEELAAPPVGLLVKHLCRSYLSFKS